MAITKNYSNFAAYSDIIKIDDCLEREKAETLFNNIIQGRDKISFTEKQSLAMTCANFHDEQDFIFYDSPIGEVFTSWDIYDTKTINTISKFSKYFINNNELLNCRFDLLVFSDKISTHAFAIESDGKHHFVAAEEANLLYQEYDKKNLEKKGMSYQNWLSVNYHDIVKQDILEQAHIPLLRIPYTLSDKDDIQKLINSFLDDVKNGRGEKWVLEHYPDKDDINYKHGFTIKTKEMYDDLVCTNGYMLSFLQKRGYLKHPDWKEREELLSKDELIDAIRKAGIKKEDFIKSGVDINNLLSGDSLKNEITYCFTRHNMEAYDLFYKLSPELIKKIPKKYPNQIGACYILWAINPDVFSNNKEYVDSLTKYIKNSNTSKRDKYLLSLTLSMKEERSKIIENNEMTHNELLDRL